MKRERILWHLGVPACRVLRGLKIHLRTISLLELGALCYYFKVNSIDHLEKKMWSIIKKREVLT